MRLLSVVGWIGLACFAILVVFTALPGEDHVLFGTSDGMPNLPNTSFIVLRFVFLVALIASQFVCVRLLSSQRDTVGDPRR